MQDSLVEANVHRKEDQARIEGASDAVNHPSHYQNISIGHLKTDQPAEKFEVADIQEGITDSLNLTPSISIAIGNAIKYICRAPFKGHFVQDLQKGSWELSRAADLGAKQLAKGQLIERDGRIERK